MKHFSVTDPVVVRHLGTGYSLDVSYKTCGEILLRQWRIVLSPVCGPSRPRRAAIVGGGLGRRKFPACNIKLPKLELYR